MHVTVNDKLLGLEPHAGFEVGRDVVIRAKIVRFVPEHGLAVVEIQGPKGQAATYVHVKNLEIPK